MVFVLPHLNARAIRKQMFHQCPTLATSETEVHCCGINANLIVHVSHSEIHRLMKY